jgi:hypothetical protein
MTTYNTNEHWSNSVRSPREWKKNRAPLESKTVILREIFCLTTFCHDSTRQTHRLDGPPDAAESLVLDSCFKIVFSSAFDSIRRSAAVPLLELTGLATEAVGCHGQSIPAVEEAQLALRVRSRGAILVENRTKPHCSTAQRTNIMIPCLSDFDVNN